MSNKRIYIVAGMHRSGTSAFARLLPALGISVEGNLRGAAEDNAKGFWEDQDIVDLNDRVLAKLGYQWHSLDGFFLQPQDFAGAQFNRLKSEAKKLLAAKMGDASNWGVKDPRFSRLQGFWQGIFAANKITPVYLVAVRNPADVAASLAKRNGFDPVRSQLLWTLYNLDLLSGIDDKLCRIVHYEGLLDDPRTILDGLHDISPLASSDLDGEQTQEFCEEFLERGLQHNRDSVMASPLELSTALYELLCSEKNPSEQPGAGFFEAAGDLCQRIQKGTDIALALQSADALRVALEAQVADREQQIIELDEGFHKEEAQLLKNAAELTESVAFHSQREATVRKEANTLEQELRQAIEQGIAWAEQLQNDLASVQGFAQQEAARADAAAQLQEEATRQLQESSEQLRQTSGQLAETRAELALVHHSLSWRITRPLRWGNFQLRRLVKSSWGLLRRSVKSIVYLLPRESRLRQGLLQVYLRVRAGLEGELDSRALRLSHQSIIAHRQNVLGAYTCLGGSDLPNLDISVVTHNSARWLRSFIDSLLEQDYPLEKIALYVVDNASTDETVASWQEIKKELEGELREFQLLEASNDGFGAGHNKAAALGSADLLLVTNVDLVFDARALVEIVSFASQDDADVASWELRQKPYEHPKFYDPVTLETGWSSHACILMRRELYEQVGGYEERIFMYGEDVELSFRYRSHGYKLRYFPRSVVLHYTYETAGELKPLQFYGSTLSNAFLRLRYGSLVDMLAIPALYGKLLTMDTGLPNARRQLRANLLKLVRNAPYFLGKRRRGQGRFPFRHWDYEITRDGAFYESPHPEIAEYPLVSVITRTYAGRDYLLRECVQSVMHQTWPNLELVIVEDGGETQRDTVDELISRYPDRHISYTPLPKLGRCLVGNEGLARAKGDYLVFLDDDDLLFCDHVETCVLELLSDATLGGVYALPWDVQTRFNSTALADGYEEKSHGTDDVLRQPFDREVMRHHNYIAIQSIVFRRQLYDQFGGFDEELDNLEDWNLWLRYCSEMDFKLVEKTTSMYRTPWELGDKANRQRSLDHYYAVARDKNEAFLAAQTAAGPV